MTASLGSSGIGQGGSERHLRGDHQPSSHSGAGRSGGSRAVGGGGGGSVSASPRQHYYRSIGTQPAGATEARSQQRRHGGAQHSAQHVAASTTRASASSFGGHAGTSTTSVASGLSSRASSHAAHTATSSAAAAVAQASVATAGSGRSGRIGAAASAAASTVQPAASTGSGTGHAGAGAWRSPRSPSGGSRAGSRSRRERSRSPREYLVEVITPRQAARALSRGIAPAAPLGPDCAAHCDDSPAHRCPAACSRSGAVYCEGKTAPESPKLLLLYPSAADGNEETLSLPRSDSSISASSNECDIKERLHKTLNIAKSGFGEQDAVGTGSLGSAHDRNAGQPHAASAAAATATAACGIATPRGRHAGPPVSGSGGSSWSGAAAPPMPVPSAVAVRSGRSPRLRSPRRQDQSVAAAAGSGCGGSSSSSMGVPGSGLAASQPVAPGPAAAAAALLATPRGVLPLVASRAATYSTAAAPASSFGLGTRATVPAVSSPRAGSHLTPKRRQLHFGAAAPVAATSAAQQQRISLGQVGGIRQCVRR